MMRAFELVQEKNLELSPELEDLFARSLSLITRTFQYAKEPRDIFKAMLTRKGEVGCVLRIMHRVDFLGRYIPEFGDLTCLVQHEFFHRYTADEHTLVCIDKLDALDRSCISVDQPRHATFPHRLSAALWAFLATSLVLSGRSSCPRSFPRAILL